MSRQVPTCCQNNVNPSQHQAYHTPGYLLGLGLPCFGDLLLLPPLRRPSGDAELDLHLFGLLLRLLLRLSTAPLPAPFSRLRLRDLLALRDLRWRLRFLSLLGLRDGLRPLLGLRDLLGLRPLAGLRETLRLLLGLRETLRFLLGLRDLLGLRALLRPLLRLRETLRFLLGLRDLLRLRPLTGLALGLRRRLGLRDLLRFLLGLRLLLPLPDLLRAFLGLRDLLRLPLRARDLDRDLLSSSNLVPLRNVTAGASRG